MFSSNCNSNNHTFSADTQQTAFCRLSIIVALFITDKDKTAQMFTDSQMGKENVVNTGSGIWAILKNKKMLLHTTTWIYLENDTTD